MKIILKSDFKSLKAFISEELSDFTIITGKNGSGKTQLIELLTKKSKYHPSVAQIDLETNPHITRIQTDGIEKNESTTISNEDWKNVIRNIYDTYKSIKPTTIDLLWYIKKNNLQANIIDVLNHKKSLSETAEYKLLVMKLYSEINANHILPISAFNIYYERDAIVYSNNPANIKIFLFIEELCLIIKKKPKDLIENDFFTAPLHERLIDENDLFSSKLELIFYNYAKRRDKNDRDYYRKERYGENNLSISDIEFVESFIPPWELLNKALANNNIDFHFEGIEMKDFTVDVPLNIQLKKTSTNTNVTFENLSSGEKVIIGIILKLFTSDYYGKSLSFPELIILDEPDAHLHPEMSKLLLDVLENTFVKKYGIKIIITTHSPSTIALAPEESIYELRNGEGSSLKKVAKDEALQILTSFIPTLSIDYKNHRQVFVESPTDVEYYQTLHDKHLQFKQFDSKLYFISNGYGKSNCDQVYKIVKEIRESGNTTSFGIADWDTRNEDKDFTFVHGKEERYSVENFILDPIYLIVLLMEIDGHNIFSEIRFDKSYNLYSIGDETEEVLQGLVKYFFEKFEQKFPTFKYDSEKKKINYFNSKTVEVPSWFLTTQGHEIELKIKQIFTALEGKFRNEGDLQKRLSLIMARCYSFVPLTSIELLEKLLLA